MVNIQKAYAREINGKYEVFSSYLSVDEIELAENEYYAIIVDEDVYDNRDDGIEINAHIVEYEKNHLGNFEYIFLYDDYQSYAYELAALEDDEES
jgi:hypothetical protein